MRRRKEPLVPLLFVTLLLSGVVVYSLNQRGLLSLGGGMNLLGGFEGAQCLMVGATPLGPTDWTGYLKYSAIQAGVEFNSHTFGFAGDSVYWLNYQPTSQTIIWDWHTAVERDRLQLLVETQREVQLQNLNYNGDPLDWNIQQQFTYVQTQMNATLPSGDANRNLTRVVNTDGTISYTLVKRSILLVPADIHIAISIPPSTVNANHKSGWEEGDWNPMELWFKLDFNTWDQDVAQRGWDSSDYASEFSAGYWVNNSATSTAKNLGSAYDQAGGFPVAGWIEGYEMNIPNTAAHDAFQEILKGAQQGVLGGSGNPNFDAKQNFSPSLLGRSVELYSLPGVWSADIGYTGNTTIINQAKTFPWAGGATLPAYFRITLNTFGTYTTGNDAVGYTIYYPAVNYRIRMIYAVWGTFTYLWTVQSASDNGYVGWQDRSSTTVHVTGWWEDLMNFLLQNPWLIIVIILAVVFGFILILAIVAPWLLPQTMKMMSQSREAWKPSKPAKFSQGPK